MGVASRWMWVECMGVASGCGCKEVYRFPHITYPYILLLYLLFLAASYLYVYFLFIFNPQRASAARVTVVGLCVCVRSNLPPHRFESQKRYQRIRHNTGTITNFC